LETTLVYEKNMSKTRRVVITGMGTVCPLGNTVKDSWDAAKAGKSGIGPVSRFDASELTSRIIGEVRNFKAEDYLDTKELKKHDLYSQYAIAASQEAWDDSNRYWRNNYT